MKSMVMTSVHVCVKCKLYPMSPKVLQWRHMKQHCFIFQFDFFQAFLINFWWKFLGFLDFSKKGKKIKGIEKTKQNNWSGCKLQSVGKVLTNNFFGRPNLPTTDGHWAIWTQNKMLLLCDISSDLWIKWSTAQHTALELWTSW